MNDSITRRRTARHLRLRWAWFAGADSRVLALVPSERSFLDAQGLVVAAMACVTGFAVAVAGSGWWNVPLQNILWLGIAWTVVICMVDRLVFKNFGTGRTANLALAVPRAALSVMLALVLGLPMVQFIFQPSISKQLTQTTALEQKSARQAAIDFYEPKIKRATAEVASIHAAQTTLQNRVQKFTRLSGCESNEPSCSHTHRSGCGHWCRYYAAQAKTARTALLRARPVDRTRIETLDAKIRDWQAAETAETANRVHAIHEDQDLLARAQALSAIEQQHPEVSRYVLFVLGLFVCLDLVALVMKLSHLLITGAVYEEVAAELRERDRLQAHRLREETAVLRDRIAGEARAHADVDEVRIDVDRLRLIAEHQAKLGPKISSAPATS